ncbi:hypothetical protein [Flavobacterium sp. GNP002]
MNAYITFNANLGWKTMEKFAALMNKNKEGKWEKDLYYHDPNSTW